MRSRAKWMLAPIVLAMILYPFAGPLLTGQGTGAGDGSILNDIQMAVLHYNTSTRILVEGNEPSEGAAGEALELSVNLSMLSSSMEGGGLLGTVGAALKEYSRLAYTASLVYNASLLHSRVQLDIMRVLALLLDCQVEEALDAWNEVEADIDELLYMLEEALDTASQVEPGKLLAEDHKLVYAEGLSRIQGLYTDLSTLDRVIDALREIPDAEEACIQGGLRLGIDPGQMQGSGSPYSYEIYSLLMALQGSQESVGGPVGGMPGVGQGGQGQGGGQGAGWGEPPSDD